MKVLWSPLFLKKLKSIIDFISEDNLDAAYGLADEIQERVTYLSKFPIQGRMIQQLNDELIRELVIHKNYVIVYALKQNNIHLITIRHSRQKPKTP